RQCHDTASISVYYAPGLPVAPYTQTIYNSNSPVWNLTVYPSQGLISVHAPKAVIGQHQECVYECWEGGGDGGSVSCGNSCYLTNTLGSATETISMYGGQTSIWQAYK